MTVSMAAYANNESKSVWLVVQAHEILLLSPLAGKMPDPRQLQAQVMPECCHGCRRRAARLRTWCLLLQKKKRLARSCPGFAHLLFLYMAVSS